MKTKFNFRGTRKQIVLGLSMAMVTMVIIMVGCSKDGDLLNTATQNDNANRSMPASFIIKNGSSDQTFYVSCTCAGGFTLTANPSALYYGTTTSTTVPVSNSNYSVTFNKNQYYYIIPGGGSYGNSTKCLKIKFITGNNKPACSYNASTNTWSGLGTNSDVDATQINKSSVPECLPC